MRWLRALRHPPVVLSYHGLGTVERRHDPDNLIVEVDLFRSQVRRLLDRGYEFLKLTDFVARIRDGHAPAGCCALTFDDGTSDGASVLPGLLEELDVTATIFVCPGLAGQPYFAVAREAGVTLLTTEELRGLAANDRIELGSHTRTHRSLAQASGEEALEEMQASRRDLEEILGKPVTSFSFPGCAYSADCPDAAQRAGYALAATCAPAGGWRPYELRRESIDSLDGSFTFALKARGIWEPLYHSHLGIVGRRLFGPGRHEATAGGG